MSAAGWPGRSASAAAAIAAAADEPQAAAERGPACQALSKVLPVVAQRKLDAGGYMILRPDSGDPTECVLMALRCAGVPEQAGRRWCACRAPAPPFGSSAQNASDSRVCRAAEQVFGADTNGKGFKVPRGCGVIQGDGVTYEGLVKILDAVLDAGYSAEAAPAPWLWGCTLIWGPWSRGSLDRSMRFSCRAGSAQPVRLPGIVVLTLEPRRRWPSAWVAACCRRSTGTRCPLPPS